MPSAEDINPVLQPVPTSLVQERKRRRLVRILLAPEPTVNDGGPAYGYVDPETVVFIGEGFYTPTGTTLLKTAKILLLNIPGPVVVRAHNDESLLGLARRLGLRLSDGFEE